MGQPAQRCFRAGRWLAVSLGLQAGTASAADPEDHARVRFLLASAQADRAAAESARLLATRPDDPELVVLHVQARAALGEAADLALRIDPAQGRSEALAYVVAVVEGLSDPSPRCARVADLLADMEHPEDRAALAPVWSRLAAVCPELPLHEALTSTALPGPTASLAAQVGATDAAWGSAVEAWSATDPPDLTRAGNPWSPEAGGLGLVRARVALSAAADRARSSDDPTRLWWAREVLRWQGLPTPELDQRILELSPEAAEASWQTGPLTRWHAPLPDGPPDAVYRVREAAGVNAPDRRIRALRDVEPLVPASGPLRAEWWSHLARSHADLGHGRREVLALEEAWRAEPESLDRANAFAWAAATHRKRMPEALAAIDDALAMPMPYRADRGGPAADGAYRWNRGHAVGAALDTRGWLRFALGDVRGARADLDRALMLYRSPSATVHFHAAIVARADGAPEVALFHVQRGFSVLDPARDEAELVAEARTLAADLYAAHRWHPGGFEAWLATPDLEASGGPIVDLDQVAERLQSEPPGLPVEGGPMPELLLTVDGGPMMLDEVRGWRVVELWAAWCMNCHIQMGALEALHEEWRATGAEVSVVVVSVEDRPRSVWPDQLVGTPADDWLVAWGGPGLMDKLGASGLPATLVVDPEGRVVQTRLGWEGNLDWVRTTLEQGGAWPEPSMPDREE